MASWSLLANKEVRMATQIDQRAGAGAGSALDAFFGISSSGSSVSRELRAGVTTFLAMAYIIVVNPGILSTAIDFEGSFPQLLTVTVFAAAIGTTVMALWARLPFALAPGMGLNAYFTFSVVLGQGFEWQTALGAVFLSGILFMIISATGLREWIINGIPRSLKFAITAGIGAFLAIIGFVNSGLSVNSDATLITVGDWASSSSMWLVAAGLIITGVLVARKIPGAVLIGIVGTTVLAMITRAEVFVQGDGSLGAFSGGDIVSTPVWPGDLIGALDIGSALGTGILTVVFTFLFVDFFDTAGTLIGLSEKSGYMDEDGNMTHPRAAFMADGIATTAGAFLGTSSTTTYIESAAGIEDGGRTGLTSLTVAILFLLSLFLWPLAAMVPAVATAPALIIIGAMMMTGVSKIDWNDYRIAIPAFLTIFGMPFLYSITEGITLGIISYTAISALTGKADKVHPVMYALTGLLVLRYIVS